MKVKELIAALQKMPQDAEVFAYNNFTEEDSSVDEVVFIENPIKQYYYCQADSVARCFSANNNKVPVVVMTGDFPYYGDKMPKYNFETIDGVDDDLDDEED